MAAENVCVRSMPRNSHGPESGARFVPGSYRVVTAIPNVSDHNLVMADYQPGGRS